MSDGVRAREEGESGEGQGERARDDAARSPRQLHVPPPCRHGVPRGGTPLAVPACPRCCGAFRIRPALRAAVAVLTL